MTYANANVNRDNLIIKHLPLVKKIVNRIEVKDNALDQEDLISIGVIGLMDAINKYKPSKQVPFEAYATVRIRGCIIDELRRTGRVSRDKIAKLNEYYQAKEELEKELMREPRESEICEKLGLSEKDLSKLHETAHYLARISLDTVLFTKDDSETTLMDTIKDENMLPDEKLLKAEVKEVLLKGIESLKEREKIILNLYYVEELSLKEIAYILDISVPRVSQIHGKILIKLRDFIQKNLED